VKRIDICRLQSKNYEKRKYQLSVEASPITIGRNKKCKIAYPELKQFSRFQMTISYNKGAWEIRDGYDKNSSSNGTWLYAQSSYELTDKTTFMVHNSVIKASVKDNIYSFLNHLNR